MGTEPGEAVVDELEPDVWQRWQWLWSVVFYVLLLGASGLVLASEPLAPGEGRRLLLFVGASALWHPVGAWVIPRRWPDRQRHAGLMLLYLAVATALWLPLVRINPGFMLVIGSLYNQLFAYLPLRYSIVGSIPLTLVALLLQSREEPGSMGPDSPLLYIFLFATGSGIVVALWIDRIIRQSEQRRELIETLARTQAELASSERRAGTLAERQRLAREIHDTLAQGFISVLMHLEAAEAALPEGLPTARHHLEQAQSTARTGIEQARRVVADLRPEPLEGAPLPDAIRRVVAGWTGESGIPVESRVTGTPVRLPAEVEVTLLRATQEALANVRRHARARSVCVTLSYMADTVALDVQDDGVGMTPGEPAPDRPGGFGLTAMRERAEQLGGRLVIESAPGDGTTLALALPLAREGVA